MNRTACLASLSLCLLAGGCSGGSSGKGGGAAAVSSPTATISSQTFAVTAFLEQGPTDTTSALTFSFSDQVDAASVQVGTSVLAFEDTDRNPGGTFRPFPGSASLDATGRVLSFTPQRSLVEGQEVRVVLTTDLTSTAGESLTRGSVSRSLSFSAQVPDGVFEGRFTPLAPGSIPNPGGTPIANAPATTPTPPPSFQPEAGTDVWFIDFELRANLFSQDMDRHGLLSGDADTDAAAKELIVREVLATVSQKFLRTADGKKVTGVSFRISFTDTAPGGQAGRTHSREAVGGRADRSAGILGASLFDPGNARREDNSRRGQLGIFSRQIFGPGTVLDPSLTAGDEKFVDGSYMLGQGTAQEDRRFQTVRGVIGNWGHALGSVTAHEVGHSVGLPHDERDPLGLMHAAARRDLLVDRNARFGNGSVSLLNQNLGRSN